MTNIYSLVNVAFVSGHVIQAISKFSQRCICVIILNRLGMRSTEQGRDVQAILSPCLISLIKTGKGK